MTGFQTAGAILLLTFGSFGSTCHGQEGAGSGDTAGKQAAGSDVTLSGVDTSMLTPREKREWSTYVSELMAPCADTPVSVAQCVQEKRGCSKCVPGVKFVLRGVRDGMSQEQIEKSYHNRFDADRVKDVTIDGSPSKGPANGPVTVVEFADFECPFCAMEAPVLEKMWQGHQDTVRYVYKYFVIAAHPHGDAAARAAIAASNQGKFWEMHDLLFANRDHLEGADIDGYAKDIGLDMAKFHTDMQAQATTDRIDGDKKLGESLGVQGTPTIFINGREYDLHQDMDEWIKMEVQSAGTSAPAPAAAPSTSASGATKGGATPPKSGATSKK
jgi:protein-disulfide isomerase